MKRAIKFSVSFYVLFAGLVGISILAAGVYIVNRFDYTSLTRHSILTGSLSRWAAYSTFVDPSTKLLVLPKTIPTMFARQRIRIYQDSVGIVYDSGWSYAEELDPFPNREFESIDRVKLPEELPKNMHSIIGGRVVYRVIPIKHFHGVSGAAVAYSDKRELFIQNTNLKRTVIVFIIVAIVLLFCATILHHYILTRPLSLLARNISKKNTDSQSFRRTLARKDEIGDVARAYLSEQSRHTEFTADILHELKNPISIIRLALERLIYKADENSLKNELTKILHESGRLEQLLSGIHELGKYESLPNSDITDAKQVIDNTIEIYSHQNINYQFLSKETDKHLVRINADDLGRMLRNLIDNALDFSPAGEVIEVACEKQQSILSISVVDNGCGIRESEIDKVFDRFYSSRAEEQNPNKHSGLGLAIVNTLATRAGGRISCKSQYGMGSSFIIHIPLVE